MSCTPQSPAATRAQRSWISRPPPGFSLVPLRQVLGEHDPGDSAHRPGQPLGASVKARLGAEQLTERLGRTIRDTNCSLAACGLQVRNDLDDWQLTAVGRDWGIALMRCSRGEHRQQIVWNPAVLTLLHGKA